MEDIYKKVKRSVHLNLAIYGGIIFALLVGISMYRPPVNYTYKQKEFGYFNLHKGLEKKIEPIESTGIIKHSLKKYNSSRKDSNEKKGDK